MTYAPAGSTPRGGVFFGDRRRIPHVGWRMPRPHDPNQTATRGVAEAAATLAGEARGEGRCAAGDDHGPGAGHGRWHRLRDARTPVRRARRRARLAIRA